MKARRQIGARHVAWMRGAYGGGQARPRNPEDQPANPEPDGATRATRARNGGVPRVAAGHFQGPDFRGGAAGWNGAVFAYRQS
jgi:hypothetical protein